MRRFVTFSLSKAQLRPARQYGRMPNEITQLYSEVVEKLKSYVYRFIDPRNGKTFYIGNGKGNHVFAYAGGELVDDGPNNAFLRLPIAKWTPLVTTGSPTGDPVTPLP